MDAWFRNAIAVHERDVSGPDGVRVPFDQEPGLRRVDAPQAIRLDVRQKSGA